MGGQLGGLGLLRGPRGLTGPGGGTGPTGPAGSAATKVADLAALRAITPEPADGASFLVQGDPIPWVYDRDSGAGFERDGKTIERINGVLLASNGRLYRATAAPIVATWAALGLCVSGNYDTIHLQAHTAKGDGGGGIFDFDPDDTTSADDGGTIRVSGTRRFKRRYSGKISVRWFGAQGNGRRVSDGVTNGTTTITSATASFTQADVGKDLAITLAPETAMVGTVDIAAASYTVTGHGTPFTSLVVGNKVWIHGVLYVVIAIASDTSMSVAKYWDGRPGFQLWVKPTDTANGVAIYKAVTHQTTIASVTNGTTVVMAAGVAGSVTGLRVTFGTNDTAGIVAWGAFLNANGASGDAPPGIYFTDKITLDQDVSSGISIFGHGRAGQFGGKGTRFVLRSADTCLFDVKGLRQFFTGFTLDGNGLVTTGTVVCEYLSSEVTWKHVNVEGAKDGETDLIVYPGVSEIDNHDWKHCRVMQDCADGSRYARYGVNNSNSNAFNISFTDWCYFSGASDAHRYTQGSCDVDKAQFFLILNRILKVETYCQMATWSNIYTEQTDNGVAFAEWLGFAGAFTTRPFMFRHVQNNTTLPIKLIGTQSVEFDDCVTGGNIDCTPIADGALAGTVTCAAASQTPAGTGTDFDAILPGQCLRIGGELHIVQSITDTHDTDGLTLASSMGHTVTGVAYALAFATRVSVARRTVFLNAGTGFTGTGYSGTPRLVIDYDTSYSGTLAATAFSTHARDSVITDFTGWDVANKNVDGDAPDDIYVATLTADRTYVLNFYNWPTGRTKRFSRHGAGDAHTLTIGGVTIANAPGYPSTVEVTWSGTGSFLVMAVGMPALTVPHVAGATPTGGVSGDIKLGTGKIWVNDAGTWKSVAVA